MLIACRFVRRERRRSSPAVQFIVAIHRRVDCSHPKRIAASIESSHSSRLSLYKGDHGSHFDISTSVVHCSKYPRSPRAREKTDNVPRTDLLWYAVLPAEDSHGMDLLCSSYCSHNRDDDWMVVVCRAYEEEAECEISERHREV